MRGASSMRRVLSRSICSQTTHFGFRTVPEGDKERLVGHVFNSVAEQYDLMNDVMSGGVHRIWKDTVVSMLRPDAISRNGLQVLDVAGGTGDIAFRIAEQLMPVKSGKLRERPASSVQHTESSTEDGTAHPRIVVCDINKAMLEEGRRRASRSALLDRPGAPRMDWVTADARKLPFDDCSFDLYTIAFGIRNVTRIDEALREAHRVLRPGGRFLCLEFSTVNQPILRALYERYSFSVIPAMGGLVASDRASYQYLVESIRQFPDQETFATMIQDAGFRCVSHTNLTGGVVAVHSGFRLPP